MQSTPFPHYLVPQSNSVIFHKIILNSTRCDVSAECKRTAGEQTVSAPDRCWADSVCPFLLLSHLTTPFSNSSRTKKSSLTCTKSPFRTTNDSTPFYSHSTKNKMQLFTIYFCKMLYMFQTGFSVHHQELKTAHTASGICLTVTATCC